MNKSLICLEGSIHFNEEVKTQAVDIVMFNSGERIIINRDFLGAGITLAEYISQQINNAEKIFTQFTLIKMDELNESGSFSETIQVIYSFVSGSGQRVWQASYACQLSNEKIMVFSSLYPDEASMKNEIGRLQHCSRNFDLNKKKF